MVVDGIEAQTAVTRIPPQSGASFEIRKGQVLRVTDPQGQQVSDEQLREALEDGHDGSDVCAICRGVDGFE